MDILQKFISENNYGFDISSYQYEPSMKLIEYMYEVGNVKYENADAYYMNPEKRINKSYTGLMVYIPLNKDYLTIKPNKAYIDSEMIGITDGPVQYPVDVYGGLFFSLTDDNYLQLNSGFKLFCEKNNYRRYRSEKDDLSTYDINDDQMHLHMNNYLEKNYKKYNRLLPIHHEAEIVRALIYTLPTQALNYNGSDLKKINKQMHNEFYNNYYILAQKSEYTVPIQDIKLKKELLPWPETKLLNGGSGRI